MSVQLAHNMAVSHLKQAGPQQEPCLHSAAAETSPWCLQRSERGCHVLCLLVGQCKL